jgi:DUF1365 family protein
VHARRAFRYGVYVAVLDLGELAALDRGLRLFSYRRRNLFSFDDRDYAATLAPGADARSADGDARTLDTLLDELAALRAANGIAAPATTRLVTNLRVAGYVFNPVSFFLGYDRGGELASVIAEVNNTYGGRFRYVLGPRQRVASPRPDRIGFRHVRELFVSPFLHGDVDYELWFTTPLDADRLRIDMHVDSRTGGGRMLATRLTGTRTTLSDRTLLRMAVRYPWMTAQVIGLIHLQALRLRIAGVPYRRPGDDHRPRPDVR